jgi:hypothetical protein
MSRTGKLTLDISLLEANSGNLKVAIVYNNLGTFHNHLISTPQDSCCSEIKKLMYFLQNCQCSPNMSPSFRGLCQLQMTLRTSDPLSAYVQNN